MKLNKQRRRHKNAHTRDVTSQTVSQRRNISLISIFIFFTSFFCKWLWFVNVSIKQNWTEPLLTFLVYFLLHRQKSFAISLHFFFSLTFPRSTLARDKTLGLIRQDNLFSSPEKERRDERSTNCRVMGMRKRFRGSGLECCCGTCGFQWELDI